jgi:hypothetical protein
VHRLLTLAAPLLALLFSAVLARPAVLAQQAGGPNVLIMTRDGDRMEGRLHDTTINVNIAGKVRPIKMTDVLSINLGRAASDKEEARIATGLAAIGGTDREARDSAVAELTEIGLPVMTPLLNLYKDRDLREPDPLYRLFGRIVPGHSDTQDRSLDLVRLANGDTLRGTLLDASLPVTLTPGNTVQIPLASVRRLAMRRKTVDRSMEVHSLRHSTQIEFLDTGIGVTPTSRLDITARGYVRLDFDVDGWSSDPDGIKVPGPNYRTHLVDGFPFGALVGRVGVKGPRWLAGRHAAKSELGSGRLYLAVNDNPHWQNNIGSFQVKVRATDAYDLGDPQ